MANVQKTGGGSEKSKRRKRRWGMYVFLTLFLIAVLFLVGSDVYVGLVSENRLFSSIEDVPYRKAALVLGCARHTANRPNAYYVHRINAATELWEAGKIDAIVVSGDNSRKDYDEPSAMKADLVEKGVPAEYITIDYAGFRTLDSVIRADKIFGLEDYIIVSQSFHCQRAIYLAQKQGQEVIGYCAEDVPGASGMKIRMREVLARAKAVVDIVFGKSPKFLGKQETVCYRDSEATPSN